MNKPLLICMTPVRNEAWILKAFLTATSLWADYIIIADQGSTDGSREIALNFPKVILIDNPAVEMHQAQTRKLLFDEAKKIKGKKILFALDADEFISGDFIHSDSWKYIINSKVGEVFYFRWINLCSPSDAIFTEQWMLWASTIDDNDMESTFPDNYIHEWRLPYPKDVQNESFFEDISFIHFARVNKERQYNKNCFYQVVTKNNEPTKSFVNLYRMYHSEDNQLKSKVDNSIYSFYLNNDMDLFNEIAFTDPNSYYLKQIFQYFEQKGIRYFSGLDIWDKAFLNEYHLKDPRSVWIKIIHLYLKMSQKNKDFFIIRIIDKLLKMFKL